MVAVNYPGGLLCSDGDCAHATGSLKVTRLYGTVMAPLWHRGVFDEYSPSIHATGYNPR